MFEVLAILFQSFKRDIEASLSNQLVSSLHNHLLQLNREEAVCS